MNYIKKFNEDVKIESDNLFYFDDNAKNNIENSIIHLKDITDNYRISPGWLEFCEDEDNIYFHHDDNCNLTRFGNTINIEYRQCYKIEFFDNDEDNKKSIKFDGDYYNDDINGFLKITNELEDISSKISHFGYKMSFNTAYVNYISIIIYV